MCNAQNITAQKCHGFSVGIENGFVFVRVVEIDFIAMCGVGIDLVCVWGIIKT